MSFRDEVNSIKKTEAQYNSEKKNFELEYQRNRLISECEEYLKKYSSDYFVTKLQNEIKEKASKGEYKKNRVGGYFSFI